MLDLARAGCLRAAGREGEARDALRQARSGFPLLAEGAGEARESFLGRADVVECAIESARSAESESDLEQASKLLPASQPHAWLVILLEESRNRLRGRTASPVALRRALEGASRTPFAGRVARLVTELAAQK